MKRCALKLIIFLLAGAIINVAVAWGCTVATPLHYGRGDEQSPEDVEWARSVGFSFDAGGLPTVIQRASTFGFAVCHVYPYSIGGRIGATRYSAGLPLEAFQAHIVRSDILQEWDVVGACARQPDPYSRPFWILPYWPLWPGFAINTMFYAAILWIVFAVPGALRRRLRHKRGQCASCGYSLRESVSEKCPECGATVEIPQG
jgi:hypothetical protein